LGKNACFVGSRKNNATAPAIINIAILLMRMICFEDISGEVGSL
jgi:hypothetical protein